MKKLKLICVKLLLVTGITLNSSERHSRFNPFYLAGSLVSRIWNAPVNEPSSTLAPTKKKRPLNNSNSRMADDFSTRQSETPSRPTERSHRWEDPGSFDISQNEPEDRIAITSTKKVVRFYGGPSDFNIVANEVILLRMLLIPDNTKDAHDPNLPLFTEGEKYWIRYYAEEGFDKSFSSGYKARSKDFSLQACFTTSAQKALQYINSSKEYAKEQDKKGITSLLGARLLTQDEPPVGFLGAVIHGKKLHILSSLVNRSSEQAALFYNYGPTTLVNFIVELTTNMPSKFPQELLKLIYSYAPAEGSILFPPATSKSPAFTCDLDDKITAYQWLILAPTFFFKAMKNDHIHEIIKKEMSTRDTTHKQDKNYQCAVKIQSELQFSAKKTLNPDGHEFTIRNNIPNFPMLIMDVQAWFNTYSKMPVD